VPFKKTTTFQFAEIPHVKFSILFVFLPAIQLVKKKFIVFIFPLPIQCNPCRMKDFFFSIVIFTLMQSISKNLRSLLAFLNVDAIQMKEKTYLFPIIKMIVQSSSSENDMNEPHVTSFICSSMNCLVKW